MKIKSINLSNILSFKYAADLNNATSLEFNDKLNIIIGENGSGKSTMLEAINFVFRNILFKKLNYQESCLSDVRMKTQVANINMDTHYSGYRLDPNWNNINDPQHIIIEIEFDDADHSNVANINARAQDIQAYRDIYSSTQLQTTIILPVDNILKIYVELDNVNNTYSVVYTPGSGNIQDYLEKYKLFEKLIELYNADNNNNPIPLLNEPFAMLSAFRNYGTFNKTVSLQGATSQAQIYQTHNQEHSRSMNSVADQEPTIFSLVRLRVAEEHYKLTDTMPANDTCIQQANNLPFIQAINQRLATINLKCELRLTDKRTWSYEFLFTDIKYNQELGDINSLSAGQKSITHLIFEAYGRDNLNGGVMIIDEPEIHLHYQLQHEYLRVINEIIKTVSMQYILVTHSDELIGSNTIKYVKRFALDDERHSLIYSPSLTPSDKWLIKILDNTRSTYSLFGKAVILTEGECDEYYFRAVFNKLYPELARDVSVFSAGGKQSVTKWEGFFAGMGMKVYKVYDLDEVYNIIYTTEQSMKLGPDGSSGANLASFLSAHPNLISDIQAQYTNKIYILREGTLENYIGLSIKAQLNNLTSYCSRTNNMKNFLDSTTDSKALEIKEIMQLIKEDIYPSQAT
jgi:predicted ATP-dependent endonuclease of OLD family